MKVHIKNRKTGETALIDQLYTDEEVFDAKSEDISKIVEKQLIYAVKYMPELEKLFCTDLKYVVHCISLMGDPVRLHDYIMNELPKDLPEETINFICHIIGMEIPENCKIPRKEGETGILSILY